MTLTSCDNGTTGGCGAMESYHQNNCHRSIRGYGIYMDNMGVTEKGGPSFNAVSWTNGASV